MAKNFQINTTIQNKHNLCVQLAGDFDGSSAWELLRVLGKNSGKFNRVTIETQELKNISGFGLEIVAARLAGLDPRGTAIGFTGRHRSVFCEAGA